MSDKQNAEQSQEAQAAGSELKGLVGRDDTRWEQGYYCAVAHLLRYEGCVTTAVDELFSAGGDPKTADLQDQELFKAHGLM